MIENSSKSILKTSALYAMIDCIGVHCTQPQDVYIRQY